MRGNTNNPVNPVNPALPEHLLFNLHGVIWLNPVKLKLSLMSYIYEDIDNHVNHIIPFLRDGLTNHV